MTPSFRRPDLRGVLVNENPVGPRRAHVRRGSRIAEIIAPRGMSDGSVIVTTGVRHRQLSQSWRPFR